MAERTERRREPYNMGDLRPLYAPRSIAVIGASPRSGSFGGRTVENLAGFDGALYPINERYDEMAGIRCYPSLAALPAVPDLAVLATPAAGAEQLIEDCIAAGVPAVLVYASGFAEIGDPAQVALQERIARRAAEAGIRLLGPNCVGLLNYTSGARVTFAGVPEGRLAEGPAIGLVCQSGALGFALSQAMDRGVGFSHVLSCGNSADVDVADWVAALAEDPACTAIACVFEGLADPRKFLRAAEIAWERDKPLIVYKMATGEEGASAAMSHTGSLAGSATFWNALFERAGVVCVQDFDALVETAWFFAKADAPRAPGIAVLSGSGGAAIMAADFAEATGVALPQPSPQVVDRLRELVPPFVPARNPCDVTAGVINDLETLLACADAMLGDPAFGALVFGYTYAYETATARQPHLREIARRHGKPLIYLWLTQLLEGPGTREAERDPNIMVFRSIRRAFTTLKAWNDRAARRAAMRRAVPPSTAHDDRVAAAVILRSVPGPVLGERSSKALLAAYGIATPGERLVTDATAAVDSARAFGTPLAMKIDSADIPHKTEAGGVMLNVTGPRAAGEAFDRIMANCRAAHPSAAIDGVLVQEMVPQGLEIIAGFRNAEGFGPMLTVGLGGVLTEVLGDAVTAVAPLSEDQALDLLKRLRGARLFDGYRGSPPVAIDELARAVAAISRIASDFEDEISELDVNPLICLPDRVVAVDGLVVKSSAASPPPMRNVVREDI